MHGQTINRCFRIWAVLAILLTMSMTVLKLNRPYDNEPHTWASTHMEIMARNFAHKGILASRGIPIINNPPFGSTADSYVDWPPLYPIVLAMLFRRFGESEAVARMLGLVFSLGYLGVFYLLVKTVVDRGTAIAAVFAAQVLPIFVVYSSIWTVNAGLAMSLLAFLALYKAASGQALDWIWAVTGGLALIIGVALSWEPLLLAPSLLPICIWQRKALMTRVVLVYGAVAAATAVCLLALYLSSFPESKGTLEKAVSDRLGLGHPTGAGDLVSHGHQRVIGLTTTVSGMFLLLGEVAIVAIGSCLLWVWRRRTAENGDALVLLFGGLLLPWLLWYAIFPQHVSIHEYQLLLAVPVAALSIAVALVGLGRRFLSNRDSLEHGYRWLPLGLAPAVLLGSGLRSAHVSLTETLKKPPSPTMRYAQDLRESTERDSVVLSPLETLQVTYYANRHVIRRVFDDTALSRAMDKIPADFPAAKVYLAIPPDAISKFPAAMSRYPLVRRNDDLVLLNLNGPEAARAAGTSQEHQKIVAATQQPPAANGRSDFANR